MENTPLESVKTFDKIFKEIAGKNSKEIKPEEVDMGSLQEDIVSFFFYVTKDGKIIKIVGDNEDIRIVIEQIINAMGGGVNRKETLKDLLTCIDARVFGATFAGKTNISIHGTTQITHGKNCFREGTKYTSQILSPFRNPKEKSKDSTMTTLATQTDLDEGHYVHHFSVNPKNIENDVKNVASDGLLISDIEKLKEGLRKGATYLDSSRKIGVENELLLWVQLKEGSKVVLPSFVELVTVNEKREIDLGQIRLLLAKEHIQSEIETIELYYHKGIATVINAPEGANEFEL